MLRSSAIRRGGGGTLDKLFPGYKDKIWARVADDWKLRIIQRENSAFEKFVSSHMTFQGKYQAWKNMEKAWAPSSQFRKPSVDWRRQLARGTLHVGRWFEGPNGSDYRPGRTVDRLKELVPFTDAEWAQRKNYRAWDGAKLALGLWALFYGYRMTQTYPVVWC